MLTYLSEREVKAVQKFLLDERMKEAVKKVLLSGVYFDGMLTPDKPADPLKNFALAAFTTPQSSLLTQEQKGAKLEAIINAISMIETGFRELEKCKEVETPVKEVINKAR